jgi:hypothetical protein
MMVNAITNNPEDRFFDTANTNTIARLDDVTDTIFHHTANQNVTFQTTAGDFNLRIPTAAQYGRTTATALGHPIGVRTLDEYHIGTDTTSTADIFDIVAARYNSPPPMDALTELVNADPDYAPINSDVTDTTPAIVTIKSRRNGISSMLSNSTFGAYGAVVHPEIRPYTVDTVTRDIPAEVTAEEIRARYLFELDTPETRLNMERELAAIDDHPNKYRFEDELVDREVEDDI